MENSNKHASKKGMIEVTRKLRGIQEAHSEGKPVYAEMAARIQASEHAEADAMVREALEGGDE